jgi:hypothetical protein
MTHILLSYYPLLQIIIVTIVLAKGKREIYEHDLNHDDDDLYDSSSDMDPFDIDNPLDTIQAYASTFTPPSSYVRKSTYG